MFYRPTLPQTGEMWDTWLYWTAGRYYLYYLARSGPQWDNVSLATSDDGVHWEECGPILRAAPGVTWMGTGSVWPAPAAGAAGPYQMNFSEWRGPRQTIFFATSSDLRRWSRLGPEHEFVQDPRWYEPEGRWDCIWTLPRPVGGLYGYWTATPRHGTGGRFGFGQSVDGLTWEALPPPAVHGVTEGEVGAVAWIGPRCYMMYGCGGRMVTLVAEQPEGPFHRAVVNSDLLSGNTYFSRFFPAPDGLLVNHHTIARDGRVFMALLKRAVVDGAGTLRLGWWEGNDALKARRTATSAAMPAGEAPATGVRMLAERLDPQQGGVLECCLGLPHSLYQPPTGLFVPCAGSEGLAVLLDAQGRAAVIRTDAEGARGAVEHRCDRGPCFGASVSLRLVLRDVLLELYLDDLLVECLALPAVATGRIGVLGGAPDGCREFTIWR